MSKSIGVSDEMYDKLASMAESADISLMQLLDIMLQYVIIRAKIVTKTELEISDNHTDIAPPPPKQGGAFKKGVRQTRTGIVDRVCEVLANANKPLTAIEVRDSLGLRVAPAVLYISPRFQVHDTHPRTFSVKKI
jgi:hypothetical protein